MEYVTVISHWLLFFKFNVYITNSYLTDFKNMHQVLTSVVFTIFSLHIHHFCLATCSCRLVVNSKTSEEMAVLVTYDNGITQIKN
jgi:hypothetical protein